MKPFWGQLSPHTMMCVCLLTPTLSDPMDRSLPGSFVHAIIQARIIQWCLAWKIPWMEEPGRLWSMGLLRVGHAWVTSLSLFTFTHWRRKWQPAPVFLPGESQGRGAWWAAIYGITQSRTRLSDLAAAVLIKRGYLDTDMYIGRMPWLEARLLSRILPSCTQKEWTLPTSSCLQNDETINWWCFMPPSQWYSVISALAN